MALNLWHHVLHMKPVRFYTVLIGGFSRLKMLLLNVDLLTHMLVYVYGR